jgi:hypothetical protein
MDCHMVMDPQAKPQSSKSKVCPQRIRINQLLPMKMVGSKL